MLLYISLCIFVYQFILKQKTMKKEEFIIWGIAPGQTMEDVLFTQATSMSEARRAANVLICKHGCKSVRVQVIKQDFSVNDFVKAITI